MSDFRVKDALWRQLIADGVEVVFGNPGTFEQGMLDVLRDYPQLKYVMGLQEAAVLAMATNYARLGRRCAVVQLHAGVGLGNAMGALQEALRGEVPMIVLCGENSRNWETFDGYLACDLVALGRPATKWATRIATGEQFLRVMHQAWMCANTPPRGPVLIAIPMDVCDEIVDGAPVRTALSSQRDLPDGSLIDAMARGLAGARKPLILVGDALAWAGGEAEALALAQRLGAPIFAINMTMAGRLLSEPSFAGYLRLTSGDIVAHVTRQADAILSVGATLGNEIFPRTDGGYLADRAVLYQIDPNARELSKNVPATIGIATDPKTTLAALLAALERLGTPARPMVSFETGPQPPESAAGAFTPKRMMEVLAATIPPETVVVDESMTATPLLQRALRSRPDVDYLACISRGLGSGWPAGISAKLLHPGRPVVAVSADGAAMYVPVAIWTAAHHNLDVIFVVVNNRAYQILKHNISQYWRWTDQKPKSFPFMDLEPPRIRFDTLGESMGARGWRATNESELRDALRGAFSSPGPHVIDVEVHDPPPVP